MGDIEIEHINKARTFNREYSSRRTKPSMGMLQAHEVKNYESIGNIYVKLMDDLHAAAHKMTIIN